MCCMLSKNIAAARVYGCAVMTSDCNGLCIPEETVQRLHQDSQLHKHRDRGIGYVGVLV